MSHCNPSVQTRVISCHCTRFGSRIHDFDVLETLSGLEQMLLAWTFESQYYEILQRDQSLETNLKKGKAYIMDVS